MKVKEIMHSGVVWVDPERNLADVAQLMREEDVGAIPVGENDKLVGMVTDRDIVVRGLAGDSDPLQMTARDVMSKPIVYCLEDEDVDDAVRLMEQKQIRRLPVINKQKRMTGMISLGDIAATGSPDLCNETLRSVSAHHD
jgi:CBS domain-containing protein